MKVWWKMRGKIIDIDFINNFVKECEGLNKIAINDICEEAVKRINLIDEQIKLRIKLNDVISHFGYKKKNSIAEKEIINSYSNINKDYANKTLLKINDGELLVQDLMAFINTVSDGNDNNKKDFIFTVKRLFETQVLARSEEGIVSKGSNFDTYKQTCVQ
jgi:hypothetical protein